MNALERRHRKATARMVAWLQAANNARAMGEVTCLHDHGSFLVLVAEKAIDTFAPNGHPVACRCERCVFAWETAASYVEEVASNYGVDPKRHRFSALQEGSHG